MTAIVVVNALGDISDYETGKKLAGLKNADRTEYVSCEEALYQFMAPRDMFTGNTTIGAVITNAAFNKAELNKLHLWQEMRMLAALIQSAQWQMAIQSMLQVLQTRRQRSCTC